MGFQMRRLLQVHTRAVTAQAGIMMEQELEWPGTGLAGFGPMKYHSMQKYAIISKYMQL